MAISEDSDCEETDSGMTDSDQTGLIVTVFSMTGFPHTIDPFVGVISEDSVAVVTGFPPQAPSHTATGLSMTGCRGLAEWDEETDCLDCSLVTDWLVVDV